MPFRHPDFDYEFAHPNPYKRWVPDINSAPPRSAITGVMRKLRPGIRFDKYQYSVESIVFDVMAAFKGTDAGAPWLDARTSNPAAQCLLLRYGWYRHLGTSLQLFRAFFGHMRQHYEGLCGGLGITRPIATLRIQYRAVTTFFRV